MNYKGYIAMDAVMASLNVCMAVALVATSTAWYDMALAVVNGFCAGLLVMSIIWIWSNSWVERKLTRTRHHKFLLNRVGVTKK